MHARKHHASATNTAVSMTHTAVRVLLLAAAMAWGHSDAQTATDSVRSLVPTADPSRIPSHHDMMRFVNDRFPHFGGFYVGDRGQGLHINVTGPSDLQAIARLLAALYGRREWAAQPVHAHEVRYTYRELLEMLHSEQVRPIRTHTHIMMYAVDDRRNRLHFDFREGISEADVRSLIGATGLPADAVAFRWGFRWIDH